MRPPGHPLGTMLVLFLGLVYFPPAYAVPFKLQPTTQTEEAADVADQPVGSEKARNLDELQTLKNKLKETQDRLHAFEAENEALRQHTKLSKQSLGTLNESLAVANAESELFRRQYGELKLRMEALGLESVGDNKEALEQRLLKAVRDLGLVRDQKDKLSEQLVALSEAMVLYLKAAPVSDPQIRMDVEAQMRSANQLLNDSANETAAVSGPALGLDSGSVVSVKEDLSLLVANMGSRNGVKVGMPFQVVRANKMVARARVIDVRDHISGAVIEDLASTTSTVKIGDRLQVDAQQ